MSRLKETNFQNIPGWQWDAGPIFVGKDSRKHAVSYGKAVQYVEEWKRYSKLCQDQALIKRRLEKLEELKKIQPDFDLDRKWRFHWSDGKTEVGIGETVEAAFTQLGYGAGAMQALDYHEEIE